MNSAQEQVSLLEAFVAARRHEVSVYGRQWGYPPDEPWLRKLLQEWLLDGVARSPVMAEIGVGGGRWVEFYADRVQRAFLIDGTPAAETAVRCRWSGPFEFVISADGSLPAIPDGVAGYVWSYDTFVHFPCGLADAYIREVARSCDQGEYSISTSPTSRQPLNRMTARPTSIVSWRRFHPSWTPPACIERIARRRLAVGVRCSWRRCGNDGPGVALRVLWRMLRSEYHTEADGRRTAPLIHLWHRGS